MDYEDFINEWKSPLNYISCQTSGSTGKPKILNLKKEFLKASAFRTVKFFNLSCKSHLHSCISFDFIGGKMMAVRADLLSSGFSFETPSNRPLQNYSGPAIDLLAVVPSQMQYIMDNKIEMPEVRNVIIGGAPINPKLKEKIVNSGINAFETYGMTETASHIALRKVSVTPIPFYPLPGIDIAINEHHCLVIRMMEGTKHSEDGKLVEYEVTTNDIAEFSDDHKGFFIKGRADKVIISGGLKIHPESVEEILEGIFKKPILISSVSDEKWGEKIIMIIEDIEDVISDEEIMLQCRESLPKYCIPKQIIHGKIPMTGSGKKKRNC